MQIAIAVLGGGYLFYGCWPARTWGIDPRAKTPAWELEDGVDYTPADPGVAFGIGLRPSSAQAPSTAPIRAAVFGSSQGRGAGNPENLGEAGCLSS